MCLSTGAKRSPQTNSIQNYLGDFFSCCFCCCCHFCFGIRAMVCAPRSLTFMQWSYSLYYIRQQLLLLYAYVPIIQTHKTPLNIYAFMRIIIINLSLLFFSHTHSLTHSLVCSLARATYNFSSFSQSIFLVFSC